VRRQRTIAGLQLGLCLVAALGCNETPSGQPITVADIARALRGIRLVEPRFSGGFDYAPCVRMEEKGRLIPRAQCSEMPDRDSWAGRELRRLARRLQDGERFADDPRRKHALAVLEALDSDKKLLAQRSIARLESLRKVQSKSPLVLNDLAAAYCLKAERDGAAADLVKALDAIEHAYALAPNRPEVRFNRALILDRLDLVFSATEAWAEVERADPGSGWAEEATAHLRDLREPSTPSLWKAANEGLEEAAIARDQQEVERIARFDPQSAREYAMEEILGAWGDRALAGSPSLGERELQVAREVGKALVAISGDWTVRDASDQLASAITEGPASSRLRKLARGLGQFRDAQKSFGGRMTTEAIKAYRNAEVSLGSSRNPLAHWAACGKGRVLAYGGHAKEAEETFEAVVSSRNIDRYPSLRAWAEWGLGWNEARRGRFAEAFPHYDQALALYKKTGELENHAFLDELLAETLASLGQMRPAWIYRSEALHDLRRQPLSRRRHAVLMEATRVAETVGEDWASLALQSDNSLAAEKRGESAWLAEALWSQARALRHVGRNREAAAYLSRARAVARESPEGLLKDKLLADLFVAEGELGAAKSGGVAMASFNAAVEGYRKIGASRDAAYATLVRARLRFAQLNPRDAEKDLESALRSFEAMARHAGSEDLGSSYADSVQGAYDEMIGYQIEAGRGLDLGLEYLERAKALASSERLEGSESIDKLWLARAINRLPPGTYVVEYAVLPDRLVIWTFSRARSGLELKLILRADLEALVSRFVAEQRRGSFGGASGGNASKQLARLLWPADLQSPRGNPVVFIPDGALFQVPFAALPVLGDGAPLATQFPVAIATSLRALSAQSRHIQIGTRFGSVLAVSAPVTDPRLELDLRTLPGTGREVAEAARAFDSADSVILSGVSATREAVLAELSRHEVFIFAGHAVSDRERASRSFLALEPSTSDGKLGILTSSDLTGRDFGKLRLAVLSACHSLGSRSSRSAGLAGVARPFVVAGVDVVGTLWEIEDGQAGTILSEFYRSVSKGETPLRALWIAQRASLAVGDAATSSWPAFELVVSGQ
jgi:CHAT domain-containing protein